MNLLASLFRRRPAAAAPIPLMRVAVSVAPRVVIAPAVITPGKAGKKPNRIRAGIIAGAITTGVVGTAVHKIGGHESIRLQAYIPIPGDVPTACWGETRNIRMGMSFTRAQCDRMLLDRLSEFADGIESCITRPMGDDVYVAFLSLAYNIGIGSPKRPGFCQSSVVRLYNAGERRAACKAMGLYNRSGGRVVKGLVNRRAEETTLCLKGI